MRIRYIIKQIVLAFLLLFFILMLNFTMVRLMPGDPLQNIIGEEDYYRLEHKSPQVLEELREYYGLNGTIIEQFIRYIKDISEFNFGYSYKTNTPVLKEVLYNAKWTIYLIVPTLVISAILGGYFGLRAGWNPGGKLDSIATPLSLVFKSIPGNCLAIIFLIVFAYKLKFFPLSGMVSGGNLVGARRIISLIHHMIMPVGVLTIYRTSSNFLLMKSIVSELRNEEYTITAFAKGLTEKQVIRRHVLINALCPYITALCMQMGTILSGATFIEIVFSWRGMGILYFNAMSARDFPMLQLCFLISAVCVIIFDMISNILNIIIDPRIKGGESID